jgi:hypothetical protein
MRYVLFPGSHTAAIRFKPRFNYTLQAALLWPDARFDKIGGNSRRTRLEPPSNSP